MHIRILIAHTEHIGYAEYICELIYHAALERGTGIACRPVEYIKNKISSGKAVIALDGKIPVGFSYIETWSHTSFVANSGLVVAPAYRHLGIAMRIKKKVFKLSRELYPHAKIFSITTGAAVMKMNSRLGFRPVPFTDLTQDTAFWDGCKGCRNYDILQRNKQLMCLCTGLLYDPTEHKRSTKKKAYEKKSSLSL